MAGAAIETKTAGRRITRPVQFALYITTEKMDQLHRLREVTKWRNADIVEKALDLFEREWNAGKLFTKS